MRHHSKWPQTLTCHGSYSKTTSIIASGFDFLGNVLPCIALLRVLQRFGISLWRSKINVCILQHISPLIYLSLNLTWADKLHNLILPRKLIRLSEGNLSLIIYGCLKWRFKPQILSQRCLMDLYACKRLHLLFNLDFVFPPLNSPLCRCRIIESGRRIGKLGLTYIYTFAKS